MYSLYSAYSTGQSAVAGAHNRHGIVTSGWASVAGMTRMGVETRDDDEDRVPASPSSSSGASSRRHSGSVTHPVLVLLMSVILISSLPTHVQSHKQCSHYYPRDDQVSSMYFCNRFLQTIFLLYPHYVEIFSGQCHPCSPHRSVSRAGQAGVHLSANVAPVMIVMFHSLGQGNYCIVGYLNINPVSTSCLGRYLAPPVVILSDS